MAWTRGVSKLFPETLTQKAIVQWFRRQYPSLRDHLIRIDNGGKKKVQGHVLAAALGEVPGASDLFLSLPSGNYCGFWIEVKPEKFKVVPSNKMHVDRQLYFIEQMKDVGYAGEMVVGSKAGIDAIKWYMGIDR